MRIFPIAIALAFALVGPAWAASESAKMTGKDNQGQLRHRIITPAGAVGEDAQAEADPKSKIAVPKDERRYRLAAHRDSGAPNTR